MRIVDAYGEGLTVNQAFDRVMALSPAAGGILHQFLLSQRHTTHSPRQVGQK